MWRLVLQQRRLLRKKFIRLHSGSVMPSTLSKVDVVDQAPLVTAYSSQGFTLRGAQMMGSVALLPRGFFHWNISSVEQMKPEAFTLFHMVVPKIELLIIGTGSRIVQLEPSIRKFLLSKRITVEVQDTPNACATFNFLLDDGRLAAAALIPPESVD